MFEIIKSYLCFLTRVPLSIFHAGNRPREMKWLAPFQSIASLELALTLFSSIVFSSLPMCLSLKYYLIQELFPLSPRSLKKTLNKTRPHADPRVNTLPWVIRTCPPASSLPVTEHTAKPMLIRLANKIYWDTVSNALQKYKYMCAKVHSLCSLSF